MYLTHRTAGRWEGANVLRHGLAWGCVRDVSDLGVPPYALAGPELSHCFI